MKCYHCRHFNMETNICDMDNNEVLNPWDESVCDFLKDPQTVFDRITASPEVLAEASVYQNYIGLWCSPFIQWGKDTRAEAHAATVTKLKEVVE